MPELKEPAMLIPTGLNTITAIAAVWLTVRNIGHDNGMALTYALLFLVWVGLTWYYFRQAVRGTKNG